MSEFYPRDNSWLVKGTEDSVKETTTPGAVKYDAGKAPLFQGVISYFPRSLSLVASISDFGSRKYAWNGWRHVDNGFDRYSNALLRHMLSEGEGTGLDEDSRYPHIGHTLWNSCARTELWLIEQENLNGGTK